MTIEEHPQSKEEQNGVHHLGGAKFLNDPPCIICMHGLVYVRTEITYRDAASFKNVGGQ